MVEKETKNYLVRKASVSASVSAILKGSITRANSVSGKIVILKASLKRVQFLRRRIMGMILFKTASRYSFVTFASVYIRKNIDERRKDSVTYFQDS